MMKGLSLSIQAMVCVMLISACDKIESSEASPPLRQGEHFFEKIPEAPETMTQMFYLAATLAEKGKFSTINKPVKPEGASDRDVLRESLQRELEPEGRDLWEKISDVSSREYSAPYEISGGGSTFVISSVIDVHSNFEYVVSLERETGDSATVVLERPNSFRIYGDIKPMAAVVVEISRKNVARAEDREVSVDSITSNDRNKIIGSLHALLPFYLIFERAKQSTLVSTRKDIKDASTEVVKQKVDFEYLPWTLDADGYGPGECSVTEIAKSFNEARGWASKSAGWIEVHGIVESPDRISISYYDGLLRAESIRTFYKDMDTCKKSRQ